MRSLMYALGAPVGLLLLPACTQLTGPFDDPQAALDPSLPFITTDRDSYEVEPGQIHVAGHSFWYVEFTIGMTYTNRSSHPVYVVESCGGPYPPILERLSGDGWEMAYHGGGCVGGGVRPRIDPGGTYAYEFHDTAHDPDAKVILHTPWGPEESRFGSPWLPDGLEGTYRLNWSRSLRATQDPGLDPVPLEEAVSNTFRLTGTLPWER